MELNNARPVDDARTGRDFQTRPTPPANPGADNHVEGASAPPTDGGPLSAATVQKGDTRDPAAEHQFRDRLAAFQSRLDDAARPKMPSNHHLSIEVDRDSLETRFLVRDRESGEVVRRIPDDELRDLLSEAAKRGAPGVHDQLF